MFILILFIALLLYLTYNSYEKFSSHQSELVSDLNVLDEESIDSNDNSSLDINNWTDDDIKNKSGDLYKKRFFTVDKYKNILLNPSKNYIKDMTDYHFEKYGQVYNTDFNIDKLDELSSKDKEDLNNISTQYYDSMESLNYKKALVDTARIQSVEDRHLSKLNQLLD